MMQIIETMVVAQSEEKFQVLSQPLPLKIVPDTPLTTYRLEIHPEIVLLIYLVSTLDDYRKKLLAHVAPHLKSVVFLPNRKPIHHWSEAVDVLSLLSRKGENVPMLVLAELHEEDFASVSRVIREKGLFLEENARLIFWNSGEKESILQVWQTVWGKMMLSRD